MLYWHHGERIARAVRQLQALNEADTPDCQLQDGFIGLRPGILAARRLWASESVLFRRRHFAVWDNGAL